MRKINIDLDKYIVYENEDGDLYAAVDMKHQEAMIKFSREYDHFKSAPDDVTIEGYDIIPDQEPNSFTLNKNRKRQFVVNELRGTIIGIMRK